MDAVVSSALMIRLSLQPSPASETSAFNNIRAFSRRCAALLPFRISASSCSRSSPLSRTTYFFTEISVKKYVVRLSGEEREQLEALIRKGKSAAQRLLKARILLKADVSEAGEG